MAHLADFDIEHKFTAKVKETERLTPPETDEVREIKLEVQDPAFD
jgi:ferredoxin--NADP+ reductase